MGCEAALNGHSDQAQAYLLYTVGFTMTKKVTTKCKLPIPQTRLSCRTSSAFLFRNSIKLKPYRVIAGGAAYEAMKAYENHCNSEGKPDSHARAKEILAGAVGAFIDRETETRGMDFIDRVPFLDNIQNIDKCTGEKAKRDAREQAEQGLSNAGEF